MVSDSTAITLKSNERKLKGESSKFSERVDGGLDSSKDSESNRIEKIVRLKGEGTGETLKIEEEEIIETETEPGRKPTYTPKFIKNEEGQFD